MAKLAIKTMLTSRDAALRGITNLKGMAAAFEIVLDETAVKELKLVTDRLRHSIATECEGTLLHKFGKAAFIAGFFDCDGFYYL